MPKITPTLEKHVVSLALAKELKAAGYPQESLFYWVEVLIGDNIAFSYQLIRSEEWEDEERDIIAAPLASEVGEQLPILYETYRAEDLVDGEIFQCCPSDKDREEGVPFFTEDKEADARARMWLYLKKEGLIEAIQENLDFTPKNTVPVTIKIKEVKRMKFNFEDTKL